MFKLFFRDVNRKKRLNFPLDIFVEIHGNTPENNWIFMVH